MWWVPQTHMIVYVNEVTRGGHLVGYAKEMVLGGAASGG